MSSDRDENERADDAQARMPTQPVEKDTPGRTPAGFEDWDFKQQIDWVSRRHKRVRLVEMVLAEAGLDPGYDADHDNREHLTKEELAGLYIRLGGVI